MLGWCIVILASARLKASMRFPSLRGIYQRGGTCKRCDKNLESLERYLGHFGGVLSFLKHYWDLLGFLYYDKWDQRPHVQETSNCIGGPVTESRDMALALSLENYLIL